MCLYSPVGDPNLHTHVAGTAKVQGLDGAWRASDMRVLHAMAISASETYDTAVEDELRTRPLQCPRVAVGARRGEGVGAAWPTI
ncbi:MAG: relaxase domain-containing protein [Dermatophilaceae bacterium]